MERRSLSPRGRCCQQEFVRANLHASESAGDTPLLACEFANHDSCAFSKKSATERALE